MKKLIIIFLLIASLLLTGCIKSVSAETTPETIIKTETSIVTVTSLVEDTQRIDELEAELKQYQDLIGNLNNLLKDVYYGWASNSKWILDGFTAFTIIYNDKYYLITAGHCVEPKEYGKMANFKFKANFTDNWIYPKLLTYKNDVNYGNDYAIFYLDKINSGFNIGKIYGQNIVLGNIDKKINVIRNVLDIPIQGESGSPVINVNGEVIGILTGGLTNIDIVTKAIDNLE